MLNEFPNTEWIAEKISVPIGFSLDVPDILLKLNVGTLKNYHLQKASRTLPAGRLPVKFSPWRMFSFYASFLGNFDHFGFR